jgi:uncharacterized Zn-finger protein
MSILWKLSNQDIENEVSEQLISTPLKKRENKEESKTFDCTKENSSIIETSSTEVDTQKNAYSKRLDGYKYERKYVTNQETMRTNTIYWCKYGECPKTFNKAWDLLDHMRKHTGEKPYQCETWGIRFSQRGNIFKHKNKAHPRAKTTESRKRKAKGGKRGRKAKKVDESCIIRITDQ